MESYKDLKAELDELMVKVEFARKVEISDVVMEIRRKISEYKLEPKDIFPFLDKGRDGGDRNRRVPKYMDPQTGATWSGRGRPPRWILEAENRDKFLLHQEI
ncbi:H-NS histone family protein [Burkholderia cenocepacia]|uniref:H-NS histone family protein n=1 Tax=Burkholderia cenocepacia TaxID=95486 RepID=UPI002AB2186B|nr:H-NS histone family protein [Burkholderia cenocepacia]